MTSNRHSGIFYGVDLWTVLLYVLIVLAGWVSITSASYDEGTADIFSFSHFYMKQLMWIGVAWTTALVVLLLDDASELVVPIVIGPREASAIAMAQTTISMISE